MFFVYTVPLPQAYKGVRQKGKRYEGLFIRIDDGSSADSCILLCGVLRLSVIICIGNYRCGHGHLLPERGGKMITFEDIKRANDSIRTTDIKGKEYAEVNQRIKAFRMCYPTGYIITDFLSHEDGVAIMTARVGYYDEKGEEVDLGTGTAYEKEGSTFINKTSYIENCETSCVGRALGMAGFGIDVSVASAEEVQNAIAQQNATIDKDQFARLKAMYSADEIKAMQKELGISKPSEMPVDYFAKKEAEYKENTKEILQEPKDGIWG